MLASSTLLTFLGGTNLAREKSTTRTFSGSSQSSAIAESQQWSFCRKAIPLPNCVKRASLQWSRQDHSRGEFLACVRGVPRCTSAPTVVGFFKPRPQSTQRYTETNHRAIGEIVVVLNSWLASVAFLGVPLCPLWLSFLRRPQSTHRYTQTNHRGSPLAQFQHFRCRAFAAVA